jgi:hypothetical protein
MARSEFHNALSAHPAQVSAELDWVEPLNLYVDAETVKRFHWNGLAICDWSEGFGAHSQFITVSPPSHKNIVPLLTLFTPPACHPLVSADEVRLAHHANVHDRNKCVPLRNLRLLGRQPSELRAP